MSVIKPIDPTIQSLQAKKAQLLAASQAKKDIRSMLTPLEQNRYDRGGLDEVVQGIDDLIRYIETEEHI